MSQVETYVFHTDDDALARIALRETETFVGCLAANDDARGIHQYFRHRLCLNALHLIQGGKDTYLR